MLKLKYYSNKNVDCSYIIILQIIILNKQFCSRIIFLFIAALFTAMANAQQVTGVWKGKIDKKKVEIKIIQHGDSLTGSSYYYESANNYRRYSIKGYFDQQNNSVVWWDDQLLEEKTGKGIMDGKSPLLSVADFNCPGGGKMFLDGNAALKEDRENIKGPVDLQKTISSLFPDEWDFIIDNYLVGGNDPELIDSVELIAGISKQTIPVETQPTNGHDAMVFIPEPSEKNAPQKEVEKMLPVKPASIEKEKTIVPIPAPMIEEKLIARKKILVTEIPLTGDSVELRFYDNAEIDGDSISLFLNNRLIFEHIRLLGSAYTIKLSVKDMDATNELVMVAENLGSIPPNTSYMVCEVGEKRYEANLTSTEGSSAMIRFVKSKE